MVASVSSVSRTSLTQGAPPRATEGRELAPPTLLSCGADDAAPSAAEDLSSLVGQVPAVTSPAAALRPPPRTALASGPPPSAAALTALSPVDGRYAEACAPLRQTLSEAALIAARVHVEVEYLLGLASHLAAEKPALHQAVGQQAGALRALVRDFSLADAQAVAAIERRTRHDIKAVEYWLKARLAELGLAAHAEMVHFGLTSQDVNNTAWPLLLHATVENTLAPALGRIEARLHALGEAFWEQPMLARTHGQPATPVRAGKEFLVFWERLRAQREALMQVRLAAKCGGATGQLSAHAAAYPGRDWPAFADAFCASLGLARQRYTTQIGHYDDVAALLHALCRCNTVLLDLCRDLWSYIACGALRLRHERHETGSSTMPHKVNPIDFENAEGNLGHSRALAHWLADKLPVSRLQRDLSDSTALRSLGEIMGHALVAYTSLTRGLDKIDLDEAALQRDLAAHPEVLGEAIQTILRREGCEAPYEALKALTRGTQVSLADLRAFIVNLPVPAAVRQELLALRPETYLGQVPRPSPRWPSSPPTSPRLPAPPPASSPLPTSPLLPPSLWSSSRSYTPSL